MKYTVKQLIQKIENGEKPDFLFFWGHQPSKDGSVSVSCFSQWWESPFDSEGFKYKTAEHWMMAGKAKLFEPNRLEEILEAESPKKAKAIGRLVNGFSQEVWDQQKFEIVKQGTRLKFSQHDDLRDFLLDTKGKVLVEASPFDRIWGIGLSKGHKNVNDPSKWRGQNLLGFALMEIRDEFMIY